MINDFNEALNQVKEYLDGLTDKDILHKHREFQEEGFAGTRYRLRRPFDIYVDVTKESETSITNMNIDNALTQIAVESIILLSECLRRRDTILKVLTFSDEDSAKKVLAAMKSMIMNQGFITMAQYYSICNVETSKETSYYAWTDLSNVRVLRMGESYFLDLPEPTEFYIMRG